ncbi:hypothetical protein GC207_03740 [bacterium]|nr:hypothetical protein [bacterium]
MITFGNKPDPVLIGLAAVAVVVLLWWSFKNARGSAGRGRIIVLAFLRLLILAVIAFVLLDPQLMKEIKSYRPGQAVALLDTSRSMGVMEGNTSRLAIASSWLKTHWKLPAGFVGQTMTFNDELVTTGKLESAEPGGNATDILDTLADLADASAAEPPSSILLISDGSDTGSKRGTEVGERLAKMQVPVSVLMIGSTNEPPDIRVDAVESRLVTDKRTMIRVKATISAPGLGGRLSMVTISNDTQRLTGKRVLLAGDSQTVDLSFSPHRNGYQVFTLSVEPLSGERLTSNNQRDFGLTVTDPTLRVLYMEATAINNEQPEIFFLKHALEDEPGIQVRALFFDQHGGASVATREQIAYVDPRNGDEVYRVQHTRFGYPKKMEDLLRYHVIICSDVARDAFTKEQMENTVRFVEEFGGGFVMVGGETGFGAGYYDQTPVEKIIPVEMENSRDATDVSFQVRPSTAAMEHPILKMADDPAANRAIWAKLPPFFGYNRVDRAKPGATVLWEHPSDRNQYGPRVILAVQQIGKGRSMAFTTDTTSAWGYQFERMWGEPTTDGLANRLSTDARYYKQFWVNAVRWLAANRFEKEQMPVKLELASSEVRPGEEVAFTAKPELLDGKPVGELKVQARLWDGDRLVQEAGLLWDESSGAWRGSVIPDRVGKFTLKLTATNPEGQSTEAAHLLNVSELDREMAQVRARPELLEQLARETSGTVLRLDSSPEDVQTALAGLNVISVKYEKRPLWDTWVWLALIIGLLTTEWVIRRTGGLA